MMRILTVLLGLVGLVVLWGLAGAWLAPKSKQERFERDLRAAWIRVWDQTTAEVERADWPANARTMARSPQAMVLARRLESVGREAFAPAELAQPSSSQARAWMRDFLEVFYAESAGTAVPAPPLDLELLEESDGELRWILSIRSGEAQLELDVTVSYLEEEPHRVRVATLWR